mmetsp:Transcript_150724/g.261113  ORF Transcript_150724/g.261113 Transcript_150724/m.261113 type:complete len:120 (-) Transcript_150724:739-1098(-)
MALEPLIVMFTHSLQRQGLQGLQAAGGQAELDRITRKFHLVQALMHTLLPRPLEIPEIPQDHAHTRMGRQQAWPASKAHRHQQLRIFTQNYAVKWTPMLSYMLKRGITTAALNWLHLHA